MGRFYFRELLLRDKEKREVDFLVVKDGKPWWLVEVKNSSNGSPSKSLYYFQEMLGVEFAVQVALEMDYVDASRFYFAQIMGLFRIHH